MLEQLQINRAKATAKLEYLIILDDILLTRDK